MGREADRYRPREVHIRLSKVGPIGNLIYRFSLRLINSVHNSLCCRHKGWEGHVIIKIVGQWGSLKADRGRLLILERRGEQFPAHRITIRNCARALGLNVLQAVDKRFDNSLYRERGRAGVGEELENILGAREGVERPRYLGAERVGGDVAHNCQRRVP